MLEYALITATVVTAFAAASAMGVSKFWTDNLDDARNKDYLVMACKNAADCAGVAGSINSRVEYR